MSITYSFIKYWLNIYFMPWAVISIVSQEYFRYWICIWESVFNGKSVKMWIFLEYDKICWTYKTYISRKEQDALKKFSQCSINFVDVNFLTNFLLPIYRWFSPAFFFFSNCACEIFLHNPNVWHIFYLLLKWHFSSNIYLWCFNYFRNIL